MRTTRAVPVPPPPTPARDFTHSLGLLVRAISGVPDRRLDLAPSPRHADERSDRQVSVAPHRFFLTPREDEAHLDRSENLPVANRTAFFGVYSHAAPANFGAG